MNTKQMPRRTFLRGAGGVFLGLPLLEAMAPRSAAAAGVTSANAPTRMGAVYLPNGVPNLAWRPDCGSGPLKKLNKWLTPFESLKSKLQFVSGLESPTNGSHADAGATWLVRPCPDNRVARTRGVGETSMDQLVARVVGEHTPLASLELISRPEGSFSKSLLRSSISWRNGSTPLPRENNPRAVYDRLTGAGTGGKDDSGAAKSRRRSTLDAVLEDARSMQRTVSNADRDKLDEYFAAVRSVEKRMGKLAAETQAAARSKAATFSRPDEKIPEDHGAYLRMMFDMMVLAYWTDSTRVATFMLDQAQSNRYFNFVPGVSGMWHALSHWRDFSGKTEDDDGKTFWSSREEKFNQYLMVIKWHHEQVAYFLRRLDEIKEGDGTLLDNSMILYGSPFADGNEHISTNLPMFIAGKAGGKINPGRHLVHEGQPAEGAYLSMMDVMGVPVHEIGGVDKAVPIT